MSRSFQNWRAQGLCGACGSVATIKAYCPGCAEKNRERVYQIVEERKRLGLCIDCGTPYHDLRCVRCNERHNKQNRDHLRRKAEANAK